MDAYAKYQAEKDKRLYAVLDGFAQRRATWACPTRVT